MVTDSDNVVPIWTLATEDVTVPDVMNDESMTLERLVELRTVLAAMANAPIAMLEAHPLPENLDRSRGIALDVGSPLATQLSQLIASAPEIAVRGEGLYRMVIPAKFAAQVGGRLMKSSSVPGGVHSALMGPSGIVGQATFKRVARAGALVVAAPLVLNFVAAGLNARAEHQRQQALKKITELLEKLHSDALQRERNELNGCRDAIDKAAAILLDEGRIGVALGLGPAVHTINVAIEATRARLQKWQDGLKSFGDGRVEMAPLCRVFPGIDGAGGEFHAHLELAEMAIELKKRVVVIQAVELAQSDRPNPLKNFVRALKDDQERIIKLEVEIAEVLRALGRLRIDRNHGIRDFALTAGDVDHLLRTADRLRELGDRVEAGNRQSDVAIEIARNHDGSVVVFPALTA